MTEKAFKLSSPVATQGEGGTVNLSEITLRPPTARELFDFGMPFNEQDMIDGPVLRDWIMRLSGQDGSVVDDAGLSETIGIARWIGAFIKAGHKLDLTQDQDGTLTLSGITLRQPKARELFNFGMPFNGADRIDAPVLRDWMIRLSGQDGSAVDNVGLTETIGIARWIGGIFNAAGTDEKN